MRICWLDEASFVTLSRLSLTTICDIYNFVRMFYLSFICHTDIVDFTHEISFSRLIMGMDLDIGHSCDVEVSSRWPHDNEIISALCSNANNNNNNLLRRRLWCVDPHCVDCLRMRVFIICCAREIFGKFSVNRSMLMSVLCVRKVPFKLFAWLCIRNIYAQTLSTI